MKIIEKLDDFRLLPFLVLFSMAVGILIGKFYGISNFELTPPIEAIKSIFHGTYTFDLPGTLALGVVAGLFFMMYPAMTNVRIGDIGSAVKSPKQIGVVMFFNYLIAPFFMYLLAVTFLSSYPELKTGVILYGFAPCIAMVIIFTFLALGNNALALVLVALNSVIQMILIPVYAKLLIGDVSFDVLVVGESVILYLGLPLFLGVLTRHYAVKRWGEPSFEKKFNLTLRYWPAFHPHRDVCTEGGFDCRGARGHPARGPPPYNLLPRHVRGSLSPWRQAWI
jgi:ACR3 family arsenite transporter